MTQDHRASPRHKVTHTGLVLNSKNRLIAPCEIIDVSQSGARFRLRRYAKLPTQITLVLSINVGPRRRCEVIWRDSPEFGVRFLSRDPWRQKARRVRLSDKPAAALRN
jgi:hypothetical protein